MKDFKLLKYTSYGWYCPAIDFYIDPKNKVEKALITHAHSDHARPGHDYYLSQEDSKDILTHRLGKDINIETYRYHQPFVIGDIEIEFIPAGHVLGSAQIKVTDGDETWVISGDYKTENDQVTPTFSSCKCDVFVTESTFALPHFHWPDQILELSRLIDWWKQNSTCGYTSLVSTYSLGKSQRVLSLLAKYFKNDLPGKVFVHGAIQHTTEALSSVLSHYQIPVIDYKSANLKFREEFSEALVLAPGSAIQNQAWLKRFTKFETASVSGWMQVKGVQRGRGWGQGFVLSDHADWNGLISAIQASGANRVFVEHGYTKDFSRYLVEELKIDAQPTESLHRYI